MSILKDGMETRVRTSLITKRFPKLHLAKGTANAIQPLPKADEELKSHFLALLNRQFYCQKS